MIRMIRVIRVSLAVLTDAVKGELMAVYHEPVLRADRLICLLVHVNGVQVQNRAAAMANKVAVRPGVPVEMLLTVDHAYALDRPLLLKEQQIAVDGPQAQVRVVRLQGLVNPLGGGMGGGASYGLKNGLPLFAVSDGFFHARLLNSSSSCLCPHSITSPAVCKEYFGKKTGTLFLRFSGRWDFSGAQS